MRRPRNAKTRKSVSKRVKITGTGKILRNRPGKRHLLECKNPKRRRRLGRAALVASADAKNILKALPFSH